MRRYIFIILIIILMVIIYFTNFFIKKERTFNENLRLKQENEELRAQAQMYQVLGVLHQDNAYKYLRVRVFSTYPFNIKNQITINAGEKQGIEKLMGAVLGDNILVGQVVEVFENYSVIRTIFDPNWRLPVRIGKDKIDALFQGGAEPKVNLIDKEKQLQIGDVVYSASQEFFYGLKIGEILAIKETVTGVFKEAILKMPFNINELREISVIK